MRRLFFPSIQHTEPMTVTVTVIRQMTINDQDEYNSDSGAGSEIDLEDGGYTRLASDDNSMNDIDSIEGRCITFENDDCPVRNESNTNECPNECPNSNLIKNKLEMFIAKDKVLDSLEVLSESKPLPKIPSSIFECKTRTKENTLDNIVDLHVKKLQSQNPTSSRRRAFPNVTPRRNYSININDPWRETTESSMSDEWMANFDNSSINESELKTSILIKKTMERIHPFIPNWFNHQENRQSNPLSSSSIIDEKESFKILLHFLLND